MTTHTTPPPHADQTDQTAEPARRASRFDERGIALQTIIIMVVLLAIAGAVAAVLFARAEEETSRLQDSQDTFVYAIGSRMQCLSLGHDWTTTPAGLVSNATDLANLRAALDKTEDFFIGPKPATSPRANTIYIDGICKPTTP